MTTAPGDAGMVGPAPGGGKGKAQPQDPPNMLDVPRAAQADRAAVQAEAAQDTSTVSKPPEGGEDPRDARIRELEQQLAAREDAGTSGSKSFQERFPGHSAVGLRVTGDGAHESITHAGMTVGREWTEVPAYLVPVITSAAQDAGVQIEQQDQEG